MAVNTSQPRRWPKGAQEAYSEGCRCQDRAGTSGPTVGRTSQKDLTPSQSPPDLHTAYIPPARGLCPLMAISTGAPSTVGGAFGLPRHAASERSAHHRKLHTKQDCPVATCPVATWAVAPWARSGRHGSGRGNLDSGPRTGHHDRRRIRALRAVRRDQLDGLRYATGVREGVRSADRKSGV